MAMACFESLAPNQWAKKEVAAIERYVWIYLLGCRTSQQLLPLDPGEKQQEGKTDFALRRKYSIAHYEHARCTYSKACDGLGCYFWVAPPSFGGYLGTFLNRLFCP